MSCVLHLSIMTTGTPSYDGRIWQVFLLMVQVSFSCETQPQRASMGRSTEWQKEKRYVVVQMGPVATDIRPWFWAILPATSQTLQAVCSVLPLCSQELMPLLCYIPLLRHNPHILLLRDGDIMSMEGELRTEAQALLQDSSDASCAYCEDVADINCWTATWGKNFLLFFDCWYPYILFYFLPLVPLTWYFPVYRNRSLIPFSTVAWEHWSSHISVQESKLLS